MPDAQTLAIRTASMADLAAVDALFARSYPKLLKPDYAPSILVMALPRLSRAQPHLLASGRYYVAEFGRAIVAAGGWSRADPAGAAGRPELGHVRHLVCDDRVTRRGIATAVMTHTIAQAAAAGVARLDCISTLTAVPFYAALGFVVVGPVRVPLGPGIRFPGVRMQLQLVPEGQSGPAPV